MKFNVNRSDNMIIQSISLLDQLDKDLNTFAMRIKEWYSWHFPVRDAVVCAYTSPPPLSHSSAAFPLSRISRIFSFTCVSVAVVCPWCWSLQELAKIVKDNFVYARVAKFIGNRTTLDESKIEVGVVVAALAGCSCLRRGVSPLNVRRGVLDGAACAGVDGDHDGGGGVPSNPGGCKDVHGHGHVGH